MNYKMTRYFLGQLAILFAIILTIPFAISVFGRESNTPFAFGVVILGLLVIGFPAVIKKPKNRDLTPRGGLVMVALAWVLMSVIGALPLIISGEIPDFFDAFFETVSGFTTTGATISTNVEALSPSINFWRCFTHWIGGMGVLVLAIAILPKIDTATVHLMKAEVPGPQFGKLVSKLRFTARILYGIYIALTLAQIIALLLAGMNLFDAVIHSFATAGTGGFSNRMISLGYYNPAIQIITTIFMLVFSVNFNLYYFILIGHVRDAIKSEELRFMLSIFLFSTIVITLSLLFNSVYTNVGDALIHGSFQVSSILSTTGFSTANFVEWPALCQVILFLLMFVGGSAGSTAGGLKVVRVAVLSKLGFNSLRKTSNPRAYLAVRMDGKAVDSGLVQNIVTYFIVYIIIYIVSILLISIGSNFDILTDITAVSACFNNVGPGLGAVGPMGSYAGYSAFSKIILSFDMLLGRLELFPILMLFNPRAWKKIKTNNNI